MTSGTRKYEFSGQALAVMRTDPLGNLASGSGTPYFARVQYAVLILVLRISRSHHTVDILSLVDPERRVKVWVTSTEDQVTCFCIGVSSDGGRSFQNPLHNQSTRPRSPNA